MPSFDSFLKLSAFWSIHPLRIRPNHSIPRGATSCPSAPKLFSALGPTAFRTRPSTALRSAAVDEALAKATWL